MGDPLDLQEDTAFSAVLRWLGRPGYAARNVLKGNVSGAVRQAADFVLDPWDAFIPGDVIPSISQAGDFTEASDLVGGMDPGWAKTGVDILGGIATDPLTYTGLGLVKGVALAPAKAAAMGAKAVAPKIPGGVAALDAATQFTKEAGHTLRSAVGDLRPSAMLGEAVTKGKQVGAASTMAGKEFAVKTFNAYDADTQRRAIELIRGTSSELNPGTYTDLDNLITTGGGSMKAAPFVDKAEQMARIDQRLNLLPWTAPEKMAARDAAEKAIDYTRTKWDEGIRGGVFTQPTMYHDSMGGVHELDDLAQLHAASPQSAMPFDQWAQGMGFTKAPVRADLAPVDYLPGVYEMDTAATAAQKTGQPSLVSHKSIRNSKDLTEFLNKNNATLDQALPVVLGDYAERMGRAVQNAEIGRNLMPGFTSLAKDKGLFKPMIDNLRERGMLDDAVVLETAVQGLPPREGMWKLAGWANKWFKGAATGGAFIPRPAFTTRNVASGIAMVASNPTARGATLATAMRAPKDVVGAWGDGLRELGLPFAKPQHIDDIEQAIAKSGGDPEKMLASITDPTVRDAVRFNVLGSGFVDSEQMVKDLNKVAGMTFQKAKDWPSAIVRGGEDRMRLGLFDELVNTQKMAPEQAAKVVQDTLYDYSYSSLLNRKIRDLIPFFQFTAKAVPQQARFLAGSGLVPAAGRNIAEKLYGGNRDAVVPPYMQGAPLLDIGKDEAGDRQFITSLGMPWEALGQLPNPSDDLMTFLKQTRQDIVGSSNPALKTGLSAVMGVDPYFGTPFASFDKAPYALQAAGVPEHGAIGRAYNVLAGSGAIQPISSPLSVISNVLDPRTSAGETALNVASGIKIKSVDEDRALQQLVEEKLKADPSIQRYEALYAYSPDPGQQELLDELKRVKQQIREKLKAEQQP